MTITELLAVFLLTASPLIHAQVDTNSMQTKNSASQPVMIHPRPGVARLAELQDHALFL